MSARELSRLVKLPISTTYRLLGALRDLQLLEYDAATRTYRLGSALFELGARFYRQLDIARIARPVMERLAAECGETVLLTRQQGGRVICIDKIESSQTILFDIQPGTEMPLYEGAASKVLLAFLSEREMENVHRAARQRRRGVRRPPNLAQQIEEIRKCGYGFTSGEVVSDAWAVSAPVFDGFGHVAGGLSVAGPVHRLHNQVDQVARRVIAAAEQIGLALGGARPRAQTSRRTT